MRRPSGESRLKPRGQHGEIPQAQTAKKRLADVIRWAEQQGFLNVAEELRSVFADMFGK
jgi:hypothetical protein